jgi:hypothetical protein
MEQPNNKTMEYGRGGRNLPPQQKTRISGEVSSDGRQNVDLETREAIAELAYRFSKERRDGEGSPLEDWLQVERLVSEHASQLS